MRTDDKQAKAKINLWVLPIALIISVIGLDMFFRDIVYEVGLGYIITANKYTNTIYNNAKEKNVLFAQMITWTFQIHKIMTSNVFYFLLTYISYNFINIYKSFILLCTIYITNFISASIGLIFRAPRPYMVTSKIKPFWLRTDWGNPNNAIVVSIAFYCCLYTLIFRNEKKKNYICVRIVMFFLFFIINAFWIGLDIINGQVSLNQLIFSLVLGYACYGIIFFICNPQVNNPKQLYKILQAKLYYFIALNLLTFPFIFIIYFFIVHDEAEIYYEGIIRNIMRNNPITNQPEQLFKLDLFNTNSFMYDGIFINSMCCFTNIFAIIAMKCELYFSYKDNFDLWRKNNFESDEILQINYSLYTNFNNIPGTQWNHTSCCTSFMRFFAWVIVSSVSLVTFLLFYFGLIVKEKVDYNEQDAILTGIVREYLPLCIISFGMFHLLKGCMKKIKLTNKIDEFGLNTR